MSMAVFSPIFWVFSTVGGIIFGAVISVILSAPIARLQGRSVEFGALSIAAVFGASLIAAALTSFFVFRLEGGLPEFRLEKTISNAYVELIQQRFSFFILGYALGMIAGASIFFGGETSGTSGGSSSRSSDMAGLTPSLH